MKTETKVVGFAKMVEAVKTRVGVVETKVRKTETKVVGFATMIAAVETMVY